MIKQRKSPAVYVKLHLLLFVFSFAGVFSKLAGQQKDLNVRFFVYVGALFFVLFVYALGWQQVIKNLPLTVAYMNRAVVPFWMLVWGILFFGERLNIGKVAAVLCIILGVVLFSSQKNQPKDSLMGNEAEGTT